MKRLATFCAAYVLPLAVFAAPPAGPTGLRFAGPGAVVVSVSPSPVIVATGGQVQFTANVTNAANPAVIWSVVEGAGCGSVAAGGLYTAPSSAADCHVRATSVQSPGVTGTTSVSVRVSVPGGPTGTVGRWEDLTAGLASHNPGDKIQSVVSDPANPGHFYLATGNNDGRKIKWYKTVNFGDTWTLTNDTAMNGNPWGFSIDPNPSRSPSTPPTLYSPAGYGSNGAWKSTDGAATWTRLPGADTAFRPYSPYCLTDLYHPQALPDDGPNHVLTTYHYGFASYDPNRCNTGGNATGGAEGGFGETWDGGATWVVHPPAAGMGTSHYVIPISGTQWCVISQESESGLWCTMTAGRVGGTAAQKYRDGTISTAAWSKRADLAHAHGSFGSWRAPSGTWYIATYTSIAKSADGWNWTTVASGNWPGDWRGVRATNIVGTGTNLYTNYFLDPMHGRAPLSDDTAWQHTYTDPLPQAGGSPFGTAVAYASSIGKYVILMGSGDEGELWRYIEP